ncbi:MBL fold metallo-hydrolase [Alicyclobacillus macrosporangiidus]|uniref:Glyoxylase, beta-lactamase superfamily II n=1 Tax=Alicyclobacillus macrosporangiidus TaxID=392015 RepID=A0A1I7IZT0_9BACL|nr:MBL fold metallo-hydrolase [Alicyclobacillus macrosporangiidus]SFU78427.1 Glyoxylase, beta-lactamase superfamily II [Alicyclobacillus macrosporangiidus]
MLIRSFVISPFGSNCYVLAEADEPGARAVIIDPGDTAVTPVLAFVEQHRLAVEAIWNTHAHVDHVMGVDVVRDRLSVPAWLHRADVPVWEAMPESAQRWLNQTVPPLRAPDAFWEDGDVVTLGDLRFTVWHTPGHSPGSVCLIGEKVAFTGDTLFAGTIGRTDLPLSDPAAMERSLRRLQGLPDDLTIYPGHMGTSTIGRERQANPFFQMN